MCIAVVKRFVDFLGEMEEANTGRGGKRVVYADDQIINQDLMETQFKNLGLAESLIKFSDGQEVVDYFD